MDSTPLVTPFYLANKADREHEERKHFSNMSLIGKISSSKAIPKSYL